jgi:hypothetical protein
MYLACRHIKTNGNRCDFHSKLHIPVSASESKFATLHLPVMEDVPSIQLALSQVLDALISARIDPKRASQLLWGLQIASQNVSRSFVSPSRSVESVTRTKEGDDLAPEARICNGFDICVGCKYAEDCPNYDSSNVGNDDDGDD